jgi:molybdenum cofactor cytidylyltransferase
MIGAILLAGGRSRRFGSDKLSHPLGNGTPMALAALRPLLAVADPVIAVLRADSALADPLRREGAIVVTAPEADHGMSRSLASGIAAFDDQVQGCIVALADMPYVGVPTIRSLVLALEGGASLVAPTYCGTRGHPVGFARLWFNTLKRLQGDRGARDLLAVYRDCLDLIPVADPGVLADVDRLDDLELYASARL